ncbi:MAG: DUF2079 domain-containing protein [Bacteroidales bacterium]|nr:DUF2079 domain-containing protein [Bacteroidales bacterium]MCF8458115.1 DUF2079 domain-containing protein [Bacteroidales bacterium]
MIPILNHYFFRTHTFDYAAYNFSFFDYSHFRISPSPIYWSNSMSFFQDHFSLTLFYFIPIYWLFNWLTGTYTLILIQAFFILFGAWGTYKYVKLKTVSENLALFAMLFYFLLYGRYSAYNTDVNLMIILSGVVPAWLYYFEKKMWLTFSFWTLFLVLGRESIPLWLIFISLFLVIDNWQDKEKRRWAWYTMGFSLISFVLIMEVFIPMTENPARPFSLFNFNALGKTPLEVLLFMFNYPEQVFYMLFENHLPKGGSPHFKLEMYYVYLVSGGFLLFRHPKYFIPFIPIVLQKVLNDSDTRWGIYSYYTIEFATLLPLFVFVVIKDLKGRYVQKFLPWIVCTLAILVTVNKMKSSNTQLSWDHSTKFNFYRQGMYSSELDIDQMYETLKMIPDTAAVSSTGNFCPHLANREYCYYFPRVEEAEYIILQLDVPQFMVTEAQLLAELNKYIFNPKWTVVKHEGSIILLKKQEQKKDQIDDWLIDCETFSADSSLFTVPSSQIFAEGGRHRSNEMAFSGEYSIKLSPSTYNYGPYLKVDSIFPGDYIHASIRRKGSHGVLILSDEVNGLYVSAKKSFEEKGWELHTIDLTIKDSLVNNRLVIYGYNPENIDDVYFDDLHIQIYHKGKNQD